MLAAALALLIAAGSHRSPDPPLVASARADRGIAPPEEWMVQQRLSGSAPTRGMLARAAAQADRLESEAAAAPATAAKPKWEFVGPVNVGGRILDIAVDPTASDTLLIGAASGGVWKSTDAGATFAASWPALRTQAVGALAIDSSGRIFAGTGESGPGGGSLTYGGDGVWRSTNGGRKWKPTGLKDTERISRIAIDPTDDDRIWVAASGPLYTPGGARGVFRSTDGGGHWDLALAGANATTGAGEVLIDPRNPRRVFAVMWDHLRQPSLRRFGGPGSGIYRSEDGGASWQRLSGGLPGSNAEVGRIGLGLAPSDPNRLYALTIDAEGSFTGFYASQDGGDAWVRRPDQRMLADSQAYFGWWFGRVWVDPEDAQHVFVAGVFLLESFDGGATWSQQTSVHVDQHAMVWDQRLPGRVYLGNDGGVYRSDSNGGGEWTRSAVMPFTQFYSLDVSEQDAGRVVAGAQDNGCNVGGSDPSGWIRYAVCGDGLETLISFENPDLLYGCSQFGYCSRVEGGGLGESITEDVHSTRFNWWSPLVFDPNDAGILYFAGNRIDRSTDGGRSWTRISGDLTGGDPHPEDRYPFGTITTVAPARSADSVLYAGTDDGRIWSTRDLGAHWSRATDPPLPDRWVTRVAVDPEDAEIAYATFSGFRQGEPTPYVSRTTDGGASWVDITGNLPRAPLNGITVRGATLIVGGDLGVYSSANRGASWAVVGKGLPRAPVMDLRVHDASGLLFAATYGRGVWKVRLAPLQ